MPGMPKIQEPQGLQERDGAKGQCVWKNFNDYRDSGKIVVRGNCSDYQWL